MKVKIYELDKETTLENFVKDWGLDIDDVKGELENNGHYENDYISIEKENNDSLYVTIQTTYWEVIDLINGIYNNEFLMIVKDVWNGETEECETCDGCGENEDEEECVDCEGSGGCKQVMYTSFQVENNPSIVVEGNNSPKNVPRRIVFKGLDEMNIILNEKEEEEFEQLQNEGLIDYTDYLKYQTIYIVKKKEFEEKKWETCGLKISEIEGDKEIKDGLCETYYENGQLEEEGNYKNGKKDGLWKEYYENGQLSSEEEFKDDKRDGLRKSYYENGQLEEEGNYKNGKKDGLWKEYYENGQLSSEEEFEDDKRDGLWKSYYENGQLQFEVYYKDGKKNGLFKEYSYDKTGQLFVE